MNINISGEVVRTSQLPKRIIGLGDYLIALNSSPLETSTVLVSDFVSFLNTQFATSLASLTDVSINGPLVGQALVYNGSQWVNQGIGELDTLDSVTTRGNSTTNAITVGGLTANNKVYLGSNTPHSNDATNIVTVNGIMSLSNGYIRIDGQNRIQMSTSSWIWNTAILPTAVGFQGYSNVDFTLRTGSTSYNLDLGLAGQTNLRVANTTGNILIGTTTDSGYKLDVNGTIRGGVIYGSSYRLTAYPTYPLLYNSGSTIILEAPTSSGSLSFNPGGSGTTTLNYGSNSFNGALNSFSISRTYSAAAGFGTAYGVKLDVTFNETGGGKNYVGYFANYIETSFLGTLGNLIQLQRDNLDKFIVDRNGQAFLPSLTNATHASQVYYNTSTGELTYGAAPVPTTPTLDQVTTAGNTTTNAITVGDITFNNLKSPFSPFGNLITVQSSGGGRLYFNNINAWGLNGFSFGGVDANFGNGQTITFSTNSTERMRINPTTGNVGIGTTTDSGYKLDVNGTARIQGNTEINRSGADTQLTVARGGGAGFTIQGKANSTSSSEGVNLYWTADTWLKFVQGTSVVANFSNSGNFLLGTNVDANIYKLDVNGATRMQGALTVQSPEGGDAVITTFVGINAASSPFLELRNPAAINARIGGLNGGGLLFQTGTTERARIVNNGNFLIGTTTDAGYKLNVNGTARVSNTLRVVGSVGYGSNVFEFGVNGGTNANGYIDGFGRWFISNGGTNTRAAYVGTNVLYLGQNVGSPAIEFSNPNNIIGQWSGTVGTLNNTTTSETIILVNNAATANLYGMTIAGDQTAGQLSSKNLLTLSHWGSSGVQTFGSTAAAQFYNLINVNIAVSPTQANKTLRGFYYNPTISGTALSVHRAIETTSGDVLFGGTVTPFFWDNANARLGVGTNSPTERLTVNGGSISILGGGLSLFNGSTAISASSAALLTINAGGFSAVNIASGNLLVGTTTDSGYKLDVNGSARVGSLGLYGDNGTITAPLIRFNGSNKVNVDPQGYGTVTNDSLITGNYILASGGGIRANGGFGAKAGSSVISTSFMSYGISRPDADASINALAGMGGVHDGASAWYQGLGLVFYTSSGSDISGGSFLTEKMRLSSVGNLGIGTTNPTSKLYLDGGLFTKKYYTDAANNTINFGSAYELFGTLHASSGYSFFINPTGWASGWDFNIGNATTYFNFNQSSGFSAFKVTTTALSLGGGQLSYYLSSPDTGWSYTSANGWDFVIRGSADEKLRIKSGGNVLIGTSTDAGYKLDVNGTARVSGAIRTDAGNTVVALNLQGATSYIQATPSNGTSNIVLNSQSSSLILSTTANSFADIRQGTSVQHLRIGQVDSSYGGDLRFYMGNSGGMFTWSINAGGAEVMRLPGTGNLLIGTTTDAGYKLDVNGSTRVKGTGTTSATTSFYVSNSAGAQSLQILDDGTINTSTTAVFNAKFLLAVTYDISCRSIGANANAAGGTLGVGGGPGGNAGGTAVSIAYSGSPASGQIATSLSLVAIGLQSATHIGFNVNGNYSSSVGVNSLIGYNFNPTNLSTFSNVRAFQSAVGGVYVNTTSYQASAILQADSTTQGFLKPRMTTAEINAIVSPANGLEVYNTTLACPCFYDGIAWRKVSHSTM